MKKIKYILSLLLMVAAFACEPSLDEEVYSQLAPDNHLSTEAGLETVLISAYSSMQYTLLEAPAHLQTDLFVTGEAWGRGGSWEGTVTSLFTAFTWNTTTWVFNDHWNTMYDIILYTNTVLDYIDNESFSEQYRTRVKGEALALRGYAYYKLYDYFGPTVIRTTTLTTDLYMPRATEEEMKSRIEQDLSDAAALLSNVEQTAYGRITEGAALGLLCKFYLNTKQWQKCADTAKEIMDLGDYGLVENYADVFSLENEGNKEILWVHRADASPQRVSHNLVALTLPPNFPSYPNQAFFPANIYFFDDFIDSFEPGDERADLLVREYVNRQGGTVKGYGNNQSLTIKYEPDPNANGGETGNDIPEVRYADILLSRAEALNELNGPTEENIGLINEVRSRSNASLLSVNDFTKETLRDHILNERGWELYYEAKKREDLIRHGKFISGAQERGIANVTEDYKLYPIPQNEMDTNPNVEQNDGY